MMKRRRFIKRWPVKNSGFTLIEVIAALIILVIITAVAISRGTGTDEANTRAEADTLEVHLRYAQSLAMNDISSTTTGYVQWGISIQANNYSLVKYVGGVLVNPTPLGLPNESSATHSFASPITATVTTALVLFDEWGSPYSASATKMTGNSTTIATLNPGGQIIAITPETGFIP